ncbi:SRPBCC domain-containing protein [Fulvivirga sp. RKSG066]|uniref:SRPBCC family protein n=1 Tax=Fulvivirga aurantia TaxID=2529383 RepID=UPI0012BCD720|nr:SRPBCC family protein [Fulvivirga aurantia]MTI19487.1 SRPBCC domain-containing protein [Fulvivirga aurantia]
MKTTDPPIIVSQKFNNISREKLWHAITDLKEMKKWYFEQLEEFEPSVGFKTSFVVEVEDRTYTHHWQVTEVISGQRIVYKWHFDEYEGVSFSAFDIAEDDSGVTLSVTCDVAADFPEGVPEFTRDSCIGGWEYFIGQRLKEYLR